MPGVFRLAASAVAVGFFALVAAVPGRCMAETIRVGGTGAALGTMKALVSAFQASHPGVAVDVLPSLGSGGGKKALRRGAIDIAVISNQLNAEEADEGLVAVAYARSPVVFVTSLPGQRSVSSLMVADLLAGRRLKWPDGEPVRVIMRQKGESEIAAIRAISSSWSEAMDKAFEWPERPCALTDQQALDMLESNHGSFGFSVLSAVISEKRRLSVLALDDVDPADENADYPMMKTFRLVLRPDAGTGVRAFAAFATTPEGRRVLRAMGNRPIESK